MMHAGQTDCEFAARVQRSYSTMYTPPSSACCQRISATTRLKSVGVVALVIMAMPSSLDPTNNDALV